MKHVTIFSGVSKLYYINLNTWKLPRLSSGDPLLIRGGYGLIGRIGTLHVQVSGSNPDSSRMIKNKIFIYINNSSRSSIGRAEHWRCLGYKFKSCLEHIKWVCWNLVTRFRLGRNSFNFTSSSLVTHIICCRLKGKS